jgi:hypothetical protein
MTEVLIISGAYGVGKSEFACQWALRNTPCVLADIDVINPYFRPRELTSWFEEKGIKIIGSSIKHHTNQDFPALSGGFGPCASWAFALDYRLCWQCAWIETLSWFQK